MDGRPITDLPTSVLLQWRKDARHTLAQIERELKAYGRQFPRENYTQFAGYQAIEARKKPIADQIYNITQELDRRDRRRPGH